jgi:2-amino-4-hydroxy-6-hydroxymethyldihydropteridine diphosphokinase
VKRRRAIVALGSNLGDRLALLRRGLALLAAHDDVDVLRVSRVYETAPVGGPAGQPAYLNAVVAVETAMRPIDLLGLLHVIEAAADRERVVRWGPRTLDLDVVDIEGSVSDDPVLTLPHPRAHERAFVLLPWLDVEPDAVLAGHGRVADLVARLDRSGAAVRGDLSLEPVAL